MVVSRRGAHRLSIDLEHLVDKVDDPVLGDLRTRVQAALAQPVDRERRLGDLDDQGRPRRMGVQVVSRLARHDDGVRLGLRLVIESDRLLFAHVVGRAERLLERGAHEDDDGCVAPALWLAGNEQAVEQLDPVLRAEDADVDETVVSDSRHPPERKRRCLHR